MEMQIAVEVVAGVVLAFVLLGLADVDVVGIMSMPFGTHKVLLT